MSGESMSRETFAELLAPSLPALSRFVYSRLRNWDQSEDILQQALLQAFKHRDKLRNHRKFRSWLSSIAMNKIRMQHRRERPCLPLNDAPVVACLDRSLSPLEQLEGRERSNWLRGAMSSLCERDRAAIRLFDLDGLSMVETAAAMRRSQPAAKSTLFRARRKLEVALRKSALAA